MPSLDSQIIDTFLARVEERGRVGEAVVQGLASALGKDKLPKPEDLVRLYAAGGEDTVA